MKNVYISPSTQEANKGVTPFGTEEAEMNKIVDYLDPLLIKDGRFNTDRNETWMDPYQCAADSNNLKADIHVAIHSNAGGGVGTEVFTFGPNTNSEKLGKALYNQIAPLSPGIDRGVKHNPGLVEVGTTVNATSCLIELDFHDSKAGATWIAYNHEMIANALYKGICDYFGYDYKALVVTPVVSPPVTSTVDKTAQAIALIEQALLILKG
jgi:N-acetylmuramoyl-L-alanine amidase